MKTFTKAILLTALALVTFIGFVRAQWSALGALGTGPNDGCFSFSINGKGYAGAGTNAQTFYQYDTTANAWTLKGNAGGNKKRGFAFSFVINGKGYTGTGDTTGANNLCSDVWMYNPDSNSWTQKNNFPGARAGAFCFVINDTAYVGGGVDVNYNPKNDFYKYNAATDTWIPLGTLPLGVIAFPSVFTIGNKGYIATGATTVTAVSANLWEYEPIGNMWTQKANFPGTARQAGFGFSLGNFGYVGAGSDGFTNVYYDTWRYDQVADTWLAADAYPSKYPGWTTSFTIGNNAYVGVGAYFDASGFYASDSFKKFKAPAVTGIPEVKIPSEIKVYPNPAGDHITIRSASGKAGTVTINNIAGKKMKNFEGISNVLYIGDLPKGIYILRYQNGKEIFTERILKQ